MPSLVMVATCCSLEDCSLLGVTHTSTRNHWPRTQSHNRARNTVVDDETSDASVELIALVICKTRRHRAKQRPEIDLKLAHN